ncbi:hypothetical protein [Sphingomonas sp. Mn802worker]|uniref:hypothetical protein n=1 Tax=Sphingomonas sp. Mn802worker TaxID=629773 RepID=UPI0012EADEBA|nr:hypothetical protein [Sphingomonas sp. Mn802worker]
MRLTWWFDALTKLDDGDVPAQPLLQAAAEYIASGRVTGRALATMTEGWEVLLDPARDDPASLAQFAQLRGATLFQAMGALTGQDNEQVGAAGALWALSDLAANISVDRVRMQARSSALAIAGELFALRWREARSLGALALDAHMAMTGLGVADGPRRAARIALFRMIGR